MTHRSDDERNTFTPDEARQAGIVLRATWQRWVFVGSLVVAAAVAIGLGIWAS